MIDRAHQEYELATSLGRDNSLFQVIRGMLQYYSQLFQRKNGLTSRSTADAVKLLRFLSLLCEGHNKKAQEYLGKHRVVIEVANFVADLNKLLANEMSSSFLTPEEFPVKYHPKVLNKSRSLIRWISPLPTFSASSSADERPTFNNRRGSIAVGNNSHCRMLNIERMTLLCEVITQGLGALSEFCQGPRPDIQLMIARAASTREFKTFFEFFGAFHIHTRYKDTTYKPNHQRHSFQRLFRNSVKNKITQEAVLNIPTDKIYWYGSDPLAISLLVQYCHEKSQAGSISATVADIAQRRLSKLTKKLLGGKKVKGAADMLDADDFDLSGRSSEHVELNSIEFWASEKQMLVDYRKRRNKNTESIEQNWYDQISDFEENLVKLESSCLTLSMSLLEGSAPDDVFEVPKIIIANIGLENLVCNMANYWDRYFSFEPAFGTITADTCFERHQAYRYYSLIGHIQDLNFESSLKQLMDDWLLLSNIYIDEVRSMT
jgi:hypothetical protein